MDNEIEGGDVAPPVLRLLARADLDGLRGWGRHPDPLDRRYSPPGDLDGSALDAMWSQLAVRADVRSYGAFVAGELIGYLLLRGIDRAAAVAELGIALDAAWCGRGWGTAIVQRFAGEALRPGGLRALLLEVEAYNARAWALYRKSGFVETGRRWQRDPGEVDFGPLVASRPGLSEVVRTENGFFDVLIIQMRRDAPLTAATPNPVHGQEGRCALPYEP